MATSSSWRSNNGPRWSHGGATNNNSNLQGGGVGGGSSSGGAGANVPRNGSTNVIRPGVGVAAPSTASFPPLGVKGTAPSLNEADAIQRDRMIYLLVGLVGNTVVATTKSGIKYVGILSSTSVPEEGSTESLGIVLSSAQQILKDDGVGSLKKMLIIKGEDLDSFSAKDVGLDVPVSMGNANRAGFRTDTEISKKALEPFGEGRTLQKWADDPDAMPLEGDGGTFGEPSGNLSGGGGASGVGGLGGWDQFAANEARFGVKSNYEETMYTTKLDKTSRDYKERERKADQLAKEIMNTSTNNIHIAEERNLVGEGEDAQTEEDRYGAVVRGANAYIPPAARRAAAVAAAAGAQNTIKANGAAREDKATNGTPIPIITSTPAAKEGGGGGGGGEAGTATGPDAVGDFRQFVTSERERMERKKAALVKKEKESRLADLKNWGDKFKLKFPMGNEGTTTTNETEAVLEKPRDPSLQKSMSPTTDHIQKQSSKDSNKTEGSISVAASPKGGAAEMQSMSTTTTAAAAVNTPGLTIPLAETKAMLAKMTIPKIPPFNAEKARAKVNEAAAAAAAAQALPISASASKSAFKLSAKASSFKPFNPNATAFTPVGAPSPSTQQALQPPPSLPPSSTMTNATMSPQIASNTPSSFNSPDPITVKLPSNTNSFFGNRVLKKSPTPLHVREDFNPFKNGKVPESQTIGPTWGFSGKGYRNLFHAIPAEETGSMNANNMMNAAHMNQLPLPPPMAPVHNMVPMVMHPHAGMGQQGPPIPPPHLQQHQQQQQQQQPHQAQHQQQHQPGMAPNNGQPFYMPYGGPQGAPYRFQGQQSMQQMPGNYGQMPPHYLPFSPPMPPAGQAVYSPQMGNMFPPGASMHNMGVPPGQMPPPPQQQQQPPPPRNAGPGMQGKVPPHMYYANAPFPPNSAGPPGAMSPHIRHQQHNQQVQQQQQQLPPQPAQPQGQHSAAGSQSGSAAG